MWKLLIFNLTILKFILLEFPSFMEDEHLDSGDLVSVDSGKGEYLVLSVRKLSKFWFKHRSGLKGLDVGDWIWSVHLFSSLCDWKDKFRLYRTLLF